MTPEEEVAELVRRVGELEDLIAVYQVIASYGASVDGGATPEAGLLWTEDCWFDSDSSNAGDTGLHGRASIDAMAARSVGAGEAGVAHLTHLPIVKVDGDHALVVGHSAAAVQQGDAVKIWRVSANRWELDRVDGRWLIRQRTNRHLDGSAESKAILSRGVKETFRV